MNPQERTSWVVAQARALGFDLCGVAPADGLSDLAYLEEWLARGYAGEMRYLHDPRRRDPQRVVEGARNIIVCALNYNTPLPYSTEAFRAQQAAPLQEPAGTRAWISRYAWGDDYHDIIGKMLDALVAAMRAEFGVTFAARAYVDTGPVVERVAAKHAGLGWLGKNTCLINEELGSWLFLGVIVTTLELEPSADGAAGSASLTARGLAPDLCGNCRLCIEACPTGAIVEPYVLDARRCISYLTIELRGSIPEELRAPMGRHVFGCDICQDVCPYNRQAPATPMTVFLPRQLAAPNPILETRKSSAAADENREDTLTTPHSPLATPDLLWLASLTEEEFRQIFQGSAVKRAKWRGLVRNACVALGNGARLSVSAPAHSDETTQLEKIKAALERLAQSPDALIVEHALWALRQAPK